MQLLTGLLARARVVALVSCAAWPAAGCLDVPGEGDADQKAKDLGVTTQAIGDAFTNIAGAKVDLVEDTTRNRFLAVWQARDPSGVRQIAGQIFDSTSGAPLSPSRLLTVFPMDSYGPVAAVKSDGFFVAYNLRFSDADRDVRGLFVRSDGTVARDFAIDQAVTTEQVGDVAALGSDTYYVAYTRGPPHAAEVRTAYVGSNTTVFGMSAPLPVPPPSSNPRVAFVGGMLELAWADEDGEVFLGFVQPGATTIGGPPIRVATDTRATLAIAARSDTGQVALAFDDWKDSTIKVRTWPWWCQSASCIGSARTAIPAQVVNGQVVPRAALSESGLVPTPAGFVLTASDSDARTTSVRIDDLGNAGPIETTSFLGHPSTQVWAGARTADGKAFFLLSRELDPKVVGVRYTMWGTQDLSIVVAN
jgi:hypothetical protein